MNIEPHNPFPLYRVVLLTEYIFRIASLELIFGNLVTLFLFFVLNLHLEIKSIQNWEPILSIPSEITQKSPPTMEVELENVVFGKSMRPATIIIWQLTYRHVDRKKSTFRFKS